MKKFLLCSLLATVFVPNTASARFMLLSDWYAQYRHKLREAAIDNAKTVADKLDAFIAIDDVRRFTAWLKQDNIDVNTEGWGMLHIASSDGKVAFADSLLRAGANVDSADRDGITPLDTAMCIKHPAVVVRLLDAGAIPLEVAEAEELLPEDILRKRRRFHNFYVIKDYRLDPLPKQGLLLRLLGFKEENKSYERKHKWNGRTRLQLAIMQDEMDVIEKQLRGRKAKRVLNEKDENGWQAVHFAAFRGNTQALEMLWAEGAHINVIVYGSDDSFDSPYFDYTPLTIASLRGKTEAVQWLVESGADPAKQGNYGRDALQAAVLGMHIDTVRVLLDFGVPQDMIVAARELASEINAERQGYAELLAVIDAAL